MKATTYFILSIILFLTQYVVAQEIIYTREDSVIIENIIQQEAGINSSTIGDKIISIAQEFIGERYVPETLDRHSNEPLFISCTEFDCTTFVETTLAIAKTGKNDNFATACNNLELIRYRNGVRNGYASRLHYISWWIADSAKQNIIKEVYTNHHTATQQTELNFMSSNADRYNQLKNDASLINDIAKYEQEFGCKSNRYIPKENILKIEETDIKNGDIIAIVTDIKGLDVSHMGFAIWHNEKLHMIHASSSEKTVLLDTTPLADYINKRKRHIGIRVFRAL